MSRASHLAGFVPSISPKDDLNVGFVSARGLSVSGIVTFGQLDVESVGYASSSGIASALTGDASVNTTGIITAASFLGDGSGLTDVVTGIQSGGTFVGSGATILNFVGKW